MKKKKKERGNASSFRPPQLWRHTQQTLAVFLPPPPEDIAWAADGAAGELLGPGLAGQGGPKACGPPATGALSPGAGAGGGGGTLRCWPGANDADADRRMQRGVSQASARRRQGGKAGGGEEEGWRGPCPGSPGEQDTDLRPSRRLASRTLSLRWRRRRAWARGPSCQPHQAHTNKVAELIDLVGAIYSVHSRVKCSNKNLWTSASCFNFFIF